MYGGSQNISFFRNVPNELEVDTFIDEHIKRTKQQLKDKFAKVGRDLNREVQIGNFNWLKSIEVIAEDEYEALKEEINRVQLF